MGPWRLGNPGDEGDDHLGCMRRRGDPASERRPARGCLHSLPHHAHQDRADVVRPPCSSFSFNISSLRELPHLCGETFALAGAMLYFDFFPVKVTAQDRTVFGVLVCSVMAGRLTVYELLVCAL